MAEVAIFSVSAISHVVKLNNLLRQTTALFFGFPHCISEWVWVSNCLGFFLHMYLPETGHD